MPHRAAQKLREGIRADSLQRKVHSDRLFEDDIGAEHDAVTSDVRRGRELLILHRLAVVALALERHLEAAEVVEHDYLSLGEGFDDVLLHALEHGIAVALRHGGAVVDALGQLLHGELTGLDGCTVEILHLRILGVSYFLYCVGNGHS